MTRTFGPADISDVSDVSDASEVSDASGSAVVGSIKAGSVVVRPIGISPSIGTAPNETWYRGNQWPPENTEPPGANPPAAWTQNTNLHFTPVTNAAVPVSVVLPPRAWSTYHYSVVLLTEFAVNWGPSAGDAKAALDAILPANPSPALDAEKANLLELIEFRPGVLGEALSQKDSFITYFRGALSFSKATHPATFLLVHATIRIAEFVAMFYKNMYQRPRPSQLWPELMPPIDVPGHASYPSAHSTQAYTVALLLQNIAGPPGGAISPNAAGIIPSAVDVTTRLADRIARNREVLGLHYPSDSQAGRAVLAPAIWNKMGGCPTIATLLQVAQQEWATFAI